MSNLKEARPGEAQHLFEKMEENIAQPWREMLNRRAVTRRPHCNIKLDFMWRKMKKARRREVRSQLTIDWELYKEARRRFAEEKREIKRPFTNRAEGLSNQEGQKKDKIFRGRDQE